MPNIKLYYIFLIFFLLASLSISYLSYKNAYYPRVDEEFLGDNLNNIVDLFAPNKPLFPISANTTNGTMVLPVKDKINIFVPQYTRCPDICPMESLVMVYLFNSLTDREREEVVWVTVEVDVTSPLSTVESYMRNIKEKTNHDINWIWVIERGEKLESLWLQLGIKVEADNETGLIGHTAGFFVVDKEGYLRYYVKPNDWNDLKSISLVLLNILRNLEERSQ